MTSLPIQQITGQTTDHLACLEENILLHAEVIEPLQALRQRAASEGIALAVASGFRSFERQLQIWNAKAQGLRPVLDSAGTPLDISLLSERELVFAILRWSALPGASRHHWGTDMDVWDRAAVAAAYRLQLLPAEYGSGGPFARLHHWLDSPIVRALGFGRPYCADRGGVAPEPWHISYRPVAKNCEQTLSQQALATVIDTSAIQLKETILDHLDEIFSRFIRCD